MKKEIISLVLALSIVISCAFINPQKASAYSPEFETLRVGLYTTESANLRASVGDGYRFGYLDGDRAFVDLGAGCYGADISVLRDSVMHYDADMNSYELGSSGDTVIGYYHIMLNNKYDSYDGASADAENYSGSFVRYDSGSFRVMIGTYLTEDAAAEAMSERGIGNAEIDEGTNTTVSILKTGTDTILFEFDDSNGKRLCIMPVSDSGEKTKTWARSFKYYGGFEYYRESGENLTVINIVDIEDYVKGVIPYEMSNSWPIEALKTQACCARNYAMYNADCSKHSHYDICNSTCCQVYCGTNSANERTDEAVDETAGEYITYNGELCQTYFSSSNGGASESSENVWGGKYDYLVGVIDPYEAAVADIAGNYYWTVTYTDETLSERLVNRGYIPGGSLVTDLKVTTVSPTGNAIGVTVYYEDYDGEPSSVEFKSGATVCSVLNTESIRFTINGESLVEPDEDEYYINGKKGTCPVSELYAIGSGSTAKLGKSEVYALTGDGSIEQIQTGYDVYADEAEKQFVISGTGWGHNVGMSQWGAYSMAEYYGKTYKEIIRFYYTGVTVE